MDKKFVELFQALCGFSYEITFVSNKIYIRCTSNRDFISSCVLNSVCSIFDDGLYNFYVATDDDTRLPYLLISEN